MGIQFKFKHSFVTNLQTTTHSNHHDPCYCCLCRCCCCHGQQPSPSTIPPSPSSIPPSSSIQASTIYETPKPYAFQYGVADDYSKTNFNAQETADGKLTSGSYSVNLPDGRVQTVTYTVDDYAGYVADVKYEGTAQYPEYKPTYKVAPAYKPAPAPAYKPAPYHA